MQKNTLIKNYDNFLSRLDSYDFEKLKKLCHDMKQAIEENDTKKIEHLSHYMENTSEYLISFHREIDTLNSMTTFYYGLNYLDD